MENFEHLKTTESSDRLDFSVSKCTDLPDLDDEPVTSWRGDQDGGRGGGY